VKKEIPQKEVALESSSPNYKTLGAIVCATAAVLYAVYKYYPRRQQEEYHITKPLDYDVMNIWNVPSWHELEPHQQNSYLCLAVKHFFDSGGKARYYQNARANIAISGNRGDDVSHDDIIYNYNSDLGVMIDYWKGGDKSEQAEAEFDLGLSLRAINADGRLNANDKTSMLNRIKSSNIILNIE